MKKIKKIHQVILLAGFIAWAFIGYQAGIRNSVQAGEVEQKKIELNIIRTCEENDEILKQAIERASEKYGIEEKVFWAIIECEGGKMYAISKTNDIGYYQINWKTARHYGAKTLEDVIEPYKSSELCAKIIQSRGIRAWSTRKCIEKKLIYK